MIEVTRRELLAGTASLATMMALGGCETIWDAIRNRPVRRDIDSMTSNDATLQTFRAGVAAMKALPGSDPRNWQRQHQIHFDFCPHHNWFLLPWHRAYLLSFEHIIQTLTNTPSFGLPYWNWSCHPSVPAPFWQAGSPLVHPRTATAIDQANGDLVGQTNVNQILAETDFELFASGAATALSDDIFLGRLEAQPHNHIHPFVGGDMRSFHSPRDPVFWTHHCNIDRLWLVWNGRGNPNTNDPAYTNLDIDHLVDGAGNPQVYRVGLLALAPLLSYRYQPPSRFCGVFDPSIRDTAALRQFLEQGAAIRFHPLREFPAVRGVRVVIGERQPARLALPAEAVAAAFEPNAPQRTLLRLDDVTPPARGDFFIQVYVNLREGETPSTALPSYAGSFAFFVDESARHHMTHNFIVDLSGAIERLRAAGRMERGGAASVSLIAVPNVAYRPVAQGLVTIGEIAPVTIARRPVPRPLQ